MGQFEENAAGELPAVTRRATRFVVHLLGTLVGIVVVLLAAVTWRLSQGPIVLGNVTPYLEAALNRQGSAFHLGIDEAVLAWGDWQRALEVRAFGVRGLEPDGGVAFSAREVVMDISMPALLRGEIRLLNVAVINPWIRVVRTADGSVTLDIGIDQPGPTTGEEIRTVGPGELEGGDFMQAILAAGDEIPALTNLENIMVRDADLWIDDRYLDVVWNAPVADLTVTRHKDGIRVDADMVVRLDDSDVPVDATASYKPADGIVDASLRFGRLSIARLFDVLPMVPPAEGIEAPVSGHVDLKLDGDLSLLSANFGLQAGAGEIGVPGFFEQPIAFRLAVARGSLAPHLSGIELTDLRIETADGIITGYAALDGFGPDDVVDLRFEMADLPVDALPDYWPIPSATTSRQWVKEHISGGTIDRVAFEIDWRLGDLAEGDLPLADFSMDGDVTGTAVTYIPGMPPIEGVDAHIRIVDDDLHAETEGGHALGLALGTGQVTIEGLSGEPDLVVGFAFDGPLRDALTLASDPHLGFSDQLGLGPDDVAGAVAGDMQVHLATLTDELSGAHVTFDISAELSDLTVLSGVGGHDVGRGSGTIALDKQGFSLTGDIAVDDMPFAVSLDQRFVAGDAPRRQLTLNGRLEQKDLDRLGLPSMVVVEGPVDVAVGFVASWHDLATWSIDADLASARLVVPALALDKAAGDGGRLKFELIDRGGELVDLANASLDAGGLTVVADGQLAADSLDLRRLNLNRVALGRSELSGSIAANDEGSLDIRIAGGTVDLVPHMEHLTTSGDAELPDFHLDGKLDRIWLTGDDSLDAVELDALYRNDVWEKVDLTGKLAGGALASMHIWRHDEHERRFVFEAADAGDAMRLFDIFDDARGGTIDLRARIDESQDPHVATGAMRVDDFTMVKAPIMARLLSLASLTSIANAISGEGLEFKSALIPFTKTEDLVHLEDARAFGPGIGITVQGDIDVGADVLDLRGTLVPAYAVNSILGEIPLLGDILTGGDEGGGIFAVSYAVNGPLEDPSVSVEPLSVLAPGYLRTLFSAASDDEVGNYSFGETSRDR